jgi:uncharacterized protein
MSSDTTRPGALDRRSLLKLIAAAGATVPAAAATGAAMPAAAATGAAMPLAAHATSAQTRPIRVLSIDGGGMRGIIPGRFLQELEARSGRRVCEHFDLVVGTSTGAILSLGVGVPGEDGRPAYSAEDLVHLYEEAGPTIFHKSRGVLAYFKGLLRPTYDPSGYEGLLDRYFGTTALSESLVEVAVPAILLESTAMEVFTRRRATGAPSRDYLMRDLVRAATAAPSYFPAAAITSLDGETRGTYVDAGVSTNNPALIGFAEAKVVAPRAPVVMVSLGTGKKTSAIDPVRAARWGEVEWLTAVFDLQGSAQATYTHSVLSDLLVDGDDDLLFRFQVALRDVPPQMDDTTPRHMADLKRLAETEIRIASRQIDQLLERLVIA